MSEAALAAVIVIGLLHGIEPAHGWPVALFYAARKNRPDLHALLSSGIMAGTHFTSSIAAVGAYLVLSFFIPLSIPMLKYAAAILLMILAVRFWRASGEEAQHGHVHDVMEKLEHTHEHMHPGDQVHTHEHNHDARIMTLAGLAGFAFVLGFAHEEEFALLAFAVGGVDPLLLMVSYAFAVAASLIGITLLGVRAYKRLQRQMSVVERLAPKITAVILLILGAAFILGLA
jgi:hypothetical protein